MGPVEWALSKTCIKGLPAQPQHHAVESRAYAKKAHPVACLQKAFTVGQRRRHRQRDSAHIAKAGKGGKLFVLGNAQGAQYLLTVGSPT